MNCSYCSAQERGDFPLIREHDLKLQQRKKVFKLKVRLPACQSCLSRISNLQLHRAMPSSTLVLRNHAKILHASIFERGKKTGWERAVQLMASMKGLGPLLSSEEKELRDLVELLVQRTRTFEDAKRDVEEAKRLIETCSGIAYAEARRIADSEIRDERLRQTVFGAANNKCLHCGTSENLTVDHIIPVKEGGGSHLENLQCLCVKCNSRKGARI